jgi:hypothetical protein
MTGFKVVEAGVATHLVASEKLGKLEECLRPHPAKTYKTLRT